jgi:CheY-specific phosphatase CheX
VAKFTNSEKSLVEHYVYATAASAVAIWQTGNHSIKHCAFAALVGVIGPLLAKFNPKGVVSSLAKQEHLDAVQTAALTSVATAAKADAVKAINTAAASAGVTTPVVTAGS